MNYRRKANAKVLTTDCLVIDADDLARAGMLALGRLSSGRISWGGGFAVEYTVNSAGALEGAGTIYLTYCWTWRGEQELQRERYSVQLAASPMRFGGVRWQFVCPMCSEQQAVKLYLPPRARRFGCRACHALAYASQRQNYRPTKLDRQLWLYHALRR